MTTIYNMADAPKRHLRIDVQISEYATKQSNFPLHSHAKHDAARKIAEMIVNEGNFFKTTAVAHGYFNISADVIVLTSEEYRQLMQEQFRKGVDHAQGFMPRDERFI